MKLKFLFGFIFIYMLGTSLYAQSKKKIEKNRIKSVTENVTFYDNGKEISYKDYYVLFSKGGKVLEEANYNKDGTFHKRKTFKYDNNKNRIEETFYEEADKKNEIESRKIIFKYNGANDKIEELEYDGTGKIIKKVVYAYNNLGEKVSEMHYDGDENLKKKVGYAYNSKGLKIKRDNYRADNSLESIRKYTYEFY